MKLMMVNLKTGKEKPIEVKDVQDFIQDIKNDNESIKEIREFGFENFIFKEIEE